MKLFKKTTKPYYEFEYSVGDVVEMLFKGKWLVGIVGFNEYSDEVYFDGFRGGSYYKIYEHKFRQTPDTFKKAKAYYLDKS